MASAIFGYLLDDDFWLPPNVTWSDLHQKEHTETSIKYAQPEHLLIPLILCPLWLYLRHLLEKNVSRPLGVRLGLRGPRTKRKKKHGSLPKSRNYPMQNGQVDKSPKRLERLLSEEVGFNLLHRCIKACSDHRPRNSQLDKFCESFYKMGYESVLVLATNILPWSYPWFWNVLYCWHGYPHHSIPTGVWLLYIVELTHYWSHLLLHFFDVRRSDFWAVLIHHGATIFLLMLSWACNLFRVGTLVLWAHKQTDGLLNAAKLCKYVGASGASDVAFAAFAMVWLATRMGYYPTVVVYSVAAEAPQFIQYFPAYYVFSGLLAVLVLLNVMWTSSIFKAIYIAMIQGQVGEDPRSDVEDSDCENDD